ncbi:hypothetical protein ACLOJK_019115 [Asimina triloba]
MQRTLDFRREALEARLLVSSAADGFWFAAQMLGRRSLLPIVIGFGFEVEPVVRDLLVGQGWADGDAWMDRFRKGLVGPGVMIAGWPLAVIPSDGGLDDLGLLDGGQDRLLVRLKRVDQPSPRSVQRHRCREVLAVDLDADEAARVAHTPLDRGRTRLLGCWREDIVVTWMGRQRMEELLVTGGHGSSLGRWWSTECSGGPC